jgi:precorrin-6A/cobalt-precorrin-6A reductase
MRLLILGGSTEASALARRIAGRDDLAPILSFAGRTRNPVAPPIPFRVGGFGGVEGLKSFLFENKIDAVIDATHPFAAGMSSNAATACHALRLPLAVFTRPPWVSQHGDRWTSVPDIKAAAHAIGNASRRVFLTIGGVQLASFTAAPHHNYVVRTIDPPAAIAALPSHRLIVARGPFSLGDETALMRDERIEVLVTKNSGGPATAAKLTAARTLGVDVIMIERPAKAEVDTFMTVDAILEWLNTHRPTDLAD